MNSGRFPETFLQKMRGALESSGSSLFLYQHGLLKLLLCARHCSQCCKFSGDGRQHIPDFLEFCLLLQWRDITSRQTKTQRKLQITAVGKKESSAEGCHGERQGSRHQATLTGGVRTGLTESKATWTRSFYIPENLLCAVLSRSVTSDSL